MNAIEFVSLSLGLLNPIERPVFLFLSRPIGDQILIFKECCLTTTLNLSTVLRLPEKEERETQEFLVKRGRDEVNGRKTTSGRGSRDKRVVLYTEGLRRGRAGGVGGVVSVEVGFRYVEFPNQVLR